jgi:hypothetical protein
MSAGPEPQGFFAASAARGSRSPDRRGTKTARARVSAPGRRRPQFARQETWGGRSGHESRDRHGGSDRHARRLGRGVKQNPGPEVSGLPNGPRAHRARARIQVMVQIRKGGVVRSVKAPARTRRFPPRRIGRSDRQEASASSRSGAADERSPVRPTPQERVQAAPSPSSKGRWLSLSG